MKTVGILLAAGQSTRFGLDNKLLAPLQGKPLVQHAAQALRNAGFDHCLAVLSHEGVSPSLLEMDHAISDLSHTQQSDNFRLGLHFAIQQNADQAIFVLGDMPFVTSRAISEVAKRCTETSCSAATFNGRRMPPVAIPSALFSEAMAITGDQGARDLIQKLGSESLVEISADEARDIDTQDQLRAVSTQS